MQDTNVNMNKLKNDILNEVKSSESRFSESEARIKLLENEIEKNQYDSEEILKEVKTLYPDINSVSIANHTFISENDSADFKVPVFIYNINKDLNAEDKVKLMNWLKERLDLDSLEMYRKDNE